MAALATIVTLSIVGIDGGTACRAAVPESDGGEPTAVTHGLERQDAGDRADRTVQKQRSGKRSSAGRGAADLTGNKDKAAKGGKIRRAGGGTSTRRPKPAATKRDARTRSGKGQAVTTAGGTPRPTLTGQPATPAQPAPAGPASAHSAPVASATIESHLETPVLTSLTRGDDTILVQWIGVTNMINFRYYNVNVSPALASNSCLAVTGTSCTLTGTQNTVAYTISVTSIYFLRGPYTSNSMTVAGVPQAPSITAVSTASASVTVTFTAPDGDGGSAIIDYEIRATAVGDASDTAACTPAPTTAGTCTITGLTNGTAYNITGRARNSVGRSTAATWAANPVTPLSDAPGAPTGVSVTPGNRQATVNWTAPADPGAGITGYIASAAPEGGGAAQTCPAAGATTCTITGLSNGTTYTVTVIATGTSANSPSSAPGVLVTPNATPALPARVPTADGALDSSAGTSFGTAGRRTVVRGSGYAPNTPITIGLYYAATVLATAATDQLGSFSVTVTVPAGLTGQYTLVAIGLDADGNVRVLTLLISGGQVMMLAVTGPPVTWLVLAGTGLLLAGLALVGAADRRWRRYLRRHLGRAPVPT